LFCFYFLFHRPSGCQLDARRPNALSTPSDGCDQHFDAPWGERCMRIIIIVCAGRHRAQKIIPIDLSALHALFMEKHTPHLTAINA
jgi:hypothetical protein